MLRASFLMRFLFCHSGVLDYLEGFSVENLHKVGYALFLYYSCNYKLSSWSSVSLAYPLQVYEVFSNLAISARSSANFFGSSIANELLMIVRKQVLWFMSWVGAFYQCFFELNIFISITLITRIQSLHWFWIVCFMQPLQRGRSPVQIWSIRRWG